MACPRHSHTPKSYTSLSVLCKSPEWTSLRHSISKLLGYLWIAHIPLSLQLCTQTTHWWKSPKWYSISIPPQLFIPHCPLGTYIPEAFRKHRFPSQSALTISVSHTLSLLPGETERSLKQRPRASYLHQGSDACSCRSQATCLQQSLNSFPHFKWKKKKKRSNNNFGILEEYDDWCISMGNSWHVIKSMNTNYH